MQEKGPIHKAPNYSEFVFFSAGPLGDHAIELDYANRFFESTGKSSVIIYKNNFSFLKDLSIPYEGHIKKINYTSFVGKLSLVWMILSSIFVRRCYVLWVPIRYPFSMRMIAYFIRYGTQSRFVGLDVNEKTPYGDFREKSSLFFLGKQNTIPLNSHSELFYQQENRLLSFLGYNPVDRVPTLQYVPHKEIFIREKINTPYIAVHLVGSAGDRSLPIHRWREVLGEIKKKLPEHQFIFTGSSKDVFFIQQVAESMSEDSYRIVAGKINIQELLTVYAQAECCLTVHTGNAMFINMLHARSVVANIVGNYMYQYHFNPNAVVLFEKKRCSCSREAIDCFVEEDGKKYARCLYDIPNEKIVESVISQVKGRVFRVVL